MCIFFHEGSTKVHYTVQYFDLHRVLFVCFCLSRNYLLHLVCLNNISRWLIFVTRKSYLIIHHSSAPDMCFCRNKTPFFISSPPPPHHAFCSFYSFGTLNPYSISIQNRAVGRVGFFRRKSESRLMHVPLCGFSVPSPDFFSRSRISHTLSEFLVRSPF